MPRADLLRSLSAPPELIDADLVDQLADASAALARLRARTPSEPDSSWDHAYSRAQSAYLKALDALQKLRKANPTPKTCPHPAPEPSENLPPTAPPDHRPTATATPQPAPPAPGGPPLNRRARRRLEALHRSNATHRHHLAMLPGPAG